MPEYVYPPTPWAVLRGIARAFVTCRFCGAPAGVRCRTTTGSNVPYPSFVHWDRLSPLWHVYTLGRDGAPRPADDLIQQAAEMLADHERRAG